MGKHPLVKEKDINGTEKQKQGGEALSQDLTPSVPDLRVFFTVFLQIGKSDIYASCSVPCALPREIRFFSKK